MGKGVMEVVSDVLRSLVASFRRETEEALKEWSLRAWV
jgi:hypothetical protein